MKRPFKTGTWVGSGVVLLALVIGPIVLYRFVSQVRAEVQVKEAELNRLPEERAKAETLNVELAKRELDIARIDAFLVDREELGIVVGEIEAAGQAFGLDVSVPEVREREVFDENGNLVEQTGPLRDVVVQVIATGPSRQLTAFMHDVEYMPRVIELTIWRLDASERQAQNLSVGKGDEEPRESLLKLDVTLSVRAEEEAV